MITGKTVKMIVLIVGMAQVGFGPVEVEGVDWKEFRGPGADGRIEVTGEYPVEWGPDKNLEWTAKIPGEGWSSPSLADGLIILTTAVPEGDGYDLRAMALKEGSGEVVWERSIFGQPAGSPGIHKKNSHASPTPIIDGDRIYVHFGHLGTACLRLVDGSTIWKNQTIVYSPVHGNGGSPVLVDNRLIFSCDGASDPFVIGLDAGTGEEVWRTARSVSASRKFSFCTALVAEIGGRRQVVLPGSDMVAGYDPATGDEIWKVEYKGYSVVPRPVYAGGLIFISTGYDRASLLAINPEGQGNLGEQAIVWQSSRSIAKTPSFIVEDGLLYCLADNGILTCFEAASGESIYNERVGGNYSSSLLLLNGLLYCTSEEGVTSVIRPGRKFERIAENDLSERTLASLAVGNDGRILYRSQSHLHSIRLP